MYSDNIRIDLQLYMRGRAALFYHVCVCVRRRDRGHTALLSRSDELNYAFLARRSFHRPRDRASACRLRVGALNCRTIPHGLPFPRTGSIRLPF